MFYVIIRRINDVSVGKEVEGLARSDSKYCSSSLKSLSLISPEDEANSLEARKMMQWNDAHIFGAVLSSGTNSKKS